MGLSTVAAVKDVTKLLHLITETEVVQFLKVFVHKLLLLSECFCMI